MVTIMLRLTSFKLVLCIVSLLVLNINIINAEDKTENKPKAVSKAKSDSKPKAEIKAKAEPKPLVLPKAFIDGIGPGWVQLKEADFADVNGNPETWEWNDGFLKTTGKPIGVYKTKKQFTNFELVIQWRHMEFGGNSGVFAWVPATALKGLPKGKLPRGGIEVQMLDHGYLVNYKKRTGKDVSNNISTNGDIFPVGKSTLKLFPPLSENGSRSAPSKNLSNGAGKWNHYYVRGINGEIRLWVNGEEVSGGNNANPSSGHLCLEAEGAPVEYKNIRIRELP